MKRITLGQKTLKYRNLPEGMRISPRRLPAFEMLSAFFALSLILSACKPKTTPTPTSLGIPQASPTTVIPDSGLPVKDPGAPLPPQVIDQKPRGGEELPVDGEIVLEFDQAMDIEATNNALQVTSPDGAPVKGKITWPTPRSLHFKPDDSLQSATRYQVSLSVQAVSAQGVALVEPFTFQFSTVGVLQISQVFPADGAVEVAGNSSITVIFNRPVVPLVVAEEQEKLPQPLKIDPPISGKGEWVSTSVYAFQPEGVLKGSTQYVVTIPAGLEDATGETSLAKDFQWGFSTTAPSLASFELGSGYVNPEDSFKNLLLDDYFIVNFFQPMDPASTEAALSIISKSGEKVNFITEWNQEVTRLEITPTVRLSLGTDYIFSLSTEALAADGGNLSDGLTWNFTTVPPPAIVATNPSNGGTQEYFSSELYIRFASPMRIDTIKPRIVITPKPDKEIEWWYNEWDWSIVAFILEPSTSYVVQFQPGMEDIYGNKITVGKTIRFTTSAHQPSASLVIPYSPSILRADVPESHIFYADWRNIASLNLELHSITPKQFADFQTGASSSYEYNPPRKTLVWQYEAASQGKLNERVLQSFHPVMKDGSPLTPGFYFLGLDSPSIVHSERFLDHRMLVVAEANLTFKTYTTGALIWLTGLESGQPISGVGITVYDNKFNPIANGKTDDDGMLAVDLPAPAEPYDNRFAMTDEGEVFAFAVSNWGSGVNMWDYGIWGGYYGPTNQPTTYVYTERPIYRPGQPVYFKGIVRIDDDLEYSLPDFSEVHVTVANYEEVIYEEDLSISSLGSFDGKITLDSEAALGYYTISISTGKDKAVIGSVTFTVAEYRRPEFQVQVSTNPTDVLAGGKYTVQVSAEYYSGGAVAGAEVSWTLVSDPFVFIPPDEYTGFNFTDFDQDIYDSREESEQAGELIAEGVGTTDANGRFTITLTADLSKYKGSRQFTFEATLTDVAKNAVSGRVVIVAHRSQVYPGIRAKTYVAKEGESTAFEMVALDWEGLPMAGQALSVEIVERRWYSVQEQDPSGRVTWKSSVEDIPITTIEATTNEKGEAQVSFIPPNGGIFRARVTAVDTKGNPARASAYLWVASDEFIPWMQTNDRSFDLVADRKSYVPGDTAKILIASPFQGEAYALVTVERGKVRFQDVVKLITNSTVYELDITPDMVPNVFISVLVVKGVDENNSLPNYKMGITEISVDSRQQAITIQLTTDRTQAGPGEQVTYKVRTLDYQGKPISAEVSLSLSDLATLSLLPPNSTPILEFFYTRRSLGVWTTMPISLGLDDFNVSISKEVALGEGMGSGGAKGEGDLGVIDVRQDFPDTAFWDAFIVTNQQGEATVVVTLPDNLTTWRMDARAITEETLVGSATLDIISSKPLLVRPQMPRFFVVNDQAHLGAAVHNNTDQPLSVTVKLEGTGLVIEGATSQTIDIPAKSQAYVTWEVTIGPDAERVDLVFSAQAGEYSDASRPTLGVLDNQGIPVYRYEAPEVVGTSGQLTSEGTRIEAISLPEALQVNQGILNIKLSPTLAASMTDSLEYLEHFAYECVEQTVSRFLPNVITTRALKSAGLSDLKLEESLQAQVEIALQRLYAWQNPDGGWGWWGNRESDPNTSAYVVLGLVEASKAGYTINEDVLTAGVKYLGRQLLSIVRMVSPDLMNRQAFILYVLARAGKPDVSSSVQLFEQRQRLALYAEAFLAKALATADPQDARLKTFLSDIQSAAILSATGTHWEEKQVDRWNWNTDTRTTAILLSTLSDLNPTNPLNANAVRWLMSNRSNGHWLGTQETAWTLMALTNWMVASGELSADYKYAVALNGKRMGGGIADKETLRQSLELQVDVAELLTDQANRLAFAKDSGPGNLYYTAHLNVWLPVEKIRPLDQGIIITRSYYHLDDLKKPVFEAAQGDLLLARLTIIVPASVHYLVVDDPLPAGLEAVDQSLLTSPQNYEVPQEYSYTDVFWKGWGWWYFDRTQYRDERVILSASYLPAGTYVFTYMVRASTVGVFHTIPPTAREFYFPEVFGRGAGALFTVQP